jgi:uncharacterized protein YjbI with pentapeptide repeats
MRREAGRLGHLGTPGSRGGALAAGGPVWVVGPEALPAGGEFCAARSDNGQSASPHGGLEVYRRWTLSVTMLGVFAIWRRPVEGRRGHARRRAEQRLRVMRWWPVTILAIVVVLGGGALALWLLGVWSASPKGVPDPSRLRLERIKTGLAVTAGLAAAVTLLITLRRQAWSEQAQQFSQADALEQRITELYVAAAEQLGSDKAAVRLAGLYALERLGQDNVKLRQTVVEVLCAYLRMPFSPPADVLRENAAASPQALAADAEVPEPETQANRLEELQVRQTAQRLLANHLRQTQEPGTPEPDGYWRGPAGERMNLDLVGAVLVGFDLAHCHAGEVRLSGAQLHRDVNLIGVHFHGDVDFVGAQFHSNADLRRAEFHGQASLLRLQVWGDTNLHSTQFHRDTELRWVVLHGHAELVGAQFRGCVNMRDAQFRGNADLADAQFHNRAAFIGARFQGFASFRKAQFYGDAVLFRARVFGDAELREAQFHGDADLREIKVDRAVDLSAAQFYGRAYLACAELSHFNDITTLVGTHFCKDADLHDVDFRGDTYLDEAQFHGDTNLRGVKFTGNAHLGKVQFHGNADLHAAQFHRTAELGEAQFHGNVDLDEAAVSMVATTLPLGWTVRRRAGDGQEVVERASA